MESTAVSRQKDELRKKIRVVKKAMSELQIAEKSISIHHQIETMKEFQEAQTILVYMALADEVQTLSFIQKWITRKRIILPVIKGDTLELREYKAEDSLQKSDSFGILEPAQGPLISAHEVDFAIIPGLAFDKENNRLGRGKAYYDKLLREANFYKVGVCFSNQIVSFVPNDEFDVKMDRVIFA